MRQVIHSINVGLLLTGRLGTKYIEISTRIYKIIFKGQTLKDTNCISPTSLFRSYSIDLPILSSAFRNLWFFWYITFP